MPTARNDAKTAEDAKNELNALVLFKHDMSVFQRMYAFLSQIFDYGNTAIEKRFIFYKRLLPLLEFGREREGIDLSKSRSDAPQSEGSGQTECTAGRGRKPETEPTDGIRWRLRAGEGKGAARRDHHKGQ